MMNNFNLDLVLPCYNPQIDWQTALIQNVETTQKMFPSANMIVYIVNDGSTHGFDDDIKSILKKSINNLHIIDLEQNRGKGFALRKAVEYCKSEYIVYTDYDFPYTMPSLKNVINSLLNGADIVVATRSRRYRENLRFHRQFLSLTSNLCNRYILKMRTMDTQGGLKAFNRRGREIFLSTRIDTYLFDTEFIYRASHCNLNIQTIDSEIRPEIKMSNFRTKVLMRELWNLRKLL